jgi:hypothetical protein
MCTDTPYFTAAVYRAGGAQQIYLEGGCHESKSTDRNARGLADLAMAFLNDF